MAIKKALLAALLVGAAGILVFPWSLQVEEDIGLGLLFRLRGHKRPPPQVCVVALDRASAHAMGLPDKPYLWPRPLHALLVEKLNALGAAVIVFDILFEECRPDEDRGFAAAMDKGRNVVLCQSIRQQSVTIRNAEGKEIGFANLETLVSPSESLVHSAAALAPFPLPRLPLRLNQFWTLKESAGDVPTLPTVAFQVFALDVNAEFLELLGHFCPDEAAKWSAAPAWPQDAEGFADRIGEIKRLFLQRPALSRKLLDSLEEESHRYSAAALDPGRLQRLRSLIRMYGRGPNCYLNHFGPAGAFQTLSFHKMIQPGADLGNFIPAGGRMAFFVGMSESLRPQRKDGFDTVFSLASGADVSGVEIAATAFANLLQDHCVEPLPAMLRLAVIGCTGAALGLLCFLLPAFSAAVAALFFGGAYFLFALHRFDQAAAWWPLILPLGFQLPVAFFASILWKYGAVHKERRKIREAFGYYLPNGVVDGLLKDLSMDEISGRVVYGICLFTDAESYTCLSESMDPQSLNRLMNRYFDALFEPVRRYGGFVAEVIGDGMLAIWTTARPEADLCEKACMAALEISEAVASFGGSPGGMAMPTRIGLHGGYIYLGNVGARGHYAYRPVGDIVNTASRIEGLNKFLLTRTLASEEVVGQVEGVLAREVGCFVLAGKSHAVRIYELLGRKEDADDRLLSLCAVFSRGLEAFRRQSWEKALRLFGECRSIGGEDGPSRFYMEIVRGYMASPPAVDWEGSISLDRK